MVEQKEKSRSRENFENGCLCLKSQPNAWDEKSIHLETSFLRAAGAIISELQTSALKQFPNDAQTPKYFLFFLFILFFFIIHDGRRKQIVNRMFEE